MVVVPEMEAGACEMAVMVVSGGGCVRGRDGGVWCSSGGGGVWCSAVVVSGGRVVGVGVVVAAAARVYRPVGMKRQTRHIPHPRNIPR
jgi:hypothetical protein